MHLIRQILRGWLATEFLTELLLRPPQPSDNLDHVHRNPDRARLVGNRASKRLSNPPNRISREFVPTAIFEFLNSLHQTKIAFLHEVQEGLTAIYIFTRDGNDQTEVGLRHVG